MVDLRALFFGSPVRVLVTVLGLLLALVGGAVATGVIGVASVESVDNRFGPVNASTTAIESEKAVQSPDMESDQSRVRDAVEPGY